MRNNSSQKKHLAYREDRLPAMFSKSISVSSSNETSFSYLPNEYTRELLKSGDLPPLSKRSTGFGGSANVSDRKLCLAEAMSDVILSAVRRGVECGRNLSFSDAFYGSCVETYLCGANLSDDERELLVIHAKQIMIMLRRLGVIVYKDGKAEVSVDNVSYSALFNSFWNKSRWSGLFPSLEPVAEAMQDDRFLLAELLLSRDGRFLVDEVASEYFMGASSVKEMLLYVSFFDYSFFTWMRNFGIVSMCESRDGRVYAELTPWGREFLSSIE
jgi:hypothetical protein